MKTKVTDGPSKPIQRQTICSQERNHQFPLYLCFGWVKSLEKTLTRGPFNLSRRGTHSSVTYRVCWGLSSRRKLQISRLGAKNRELPHSLTLCCDRAHGVDWSGSIGRNTRFCGLGGQRLLISRFPPWVVWSLLVSLTHFPIHLLTPVYPG